LKVKVLNKKCKLINLNGENRSQTIKNLILTAILITILISCGGNDFSMKFDRQEQETDPKVLEKLEQFQDRKFGFFVHWGIYSQWGAVASWSLIEKFKDTRDIGPAFAERNNDFQRYFDDYYRLNTTFNPQKFDPHKWAAAAEAAGMKYFIMGTKHHDGFCLFDTKETDFSTTGPDCPFHTNPNANVTKVLFDAFRERGFSIGAYFSKPDWHNPYYWAPEFPHPDHSVNYDPHKYPDKWERFKDYTYNQIQELISEYGPVDILWLDGAQVLPVFDQDIDMERIAGMARKHQPGMIIVDRLGEGKYENYLTPEGNHNLPKEPLSGPWELCMTLGSGWSYRFDDVYKPATEIIHILIDVVSKGGNLLLDVGPPASGELPPLAVQILAEIGDWLRINGEGIYKTRRFPYFKENDSIRYTQSKNGGVVYAFCLEWPGTSVELTKVIPREDSKITILGTEEELSWTFENQLLAIQIPEKLKDNPDHSLQQAFVLRIEGSAAETVLEPLIRCSDLQRPYSYFFCDSYTFEINSDTPGAEIYYTLDGTVPDEQAVKYRRPVTIDRTTQVKAFAVKEGHADSPVSIQKIIKTVNQKDIQFAINGYTPFSNSDAGVINDLNRGQLDHSGGEWLGFEQNDLNAVIDFGETEQIEKISIGFLKNIYESIFLPDSVNFYASDNGKNFNNIGSVKYNISPFEQRVFVQDYVLKNINLSARFIKIEAKNMGLCPHPHFNSGGKAWLYTDEIFIE